MLGMLALDDYKELVHTDIRDLTDADVLRLYEFDVTMASFLLKTWLARRQVPGSPCDTIATQCQEKRSQ